MGVKGLKSNYPLQSYLIAQVTFESWFTNLEKTFFQQLSLYKQIICSIYFTKEPNSMTSLYQ